LILIALWALVAWGDRRPVAAALAFGALMGLAAYVRAVALPLTLMSAGYWAVRAGRRRWARIAALTLLSTAATLVVLLPWALRNRREHGVLSFSDEHGGITALIGANPNSEGTYTRALNRMFKDLTGRSVIAEPHRETTVWRSTWPRTGPASSRGTPSAWACLKASGCSGRSGTCCTGRSGGPACWWGRRSAGSRRAWRWPTRSPMGSGRPVRAVRRRRRAGRRRAPAAPAGADPLPAGADRHVHVFFAEPR